MKSLDSILYAVVSWVPGSTTNDYTPTPEAPPGVADYLHTILNWARRGSWVLALSAYVWHCRTIASPT